MSDTDPARDYEEDVKILCARLAKFYLVTEEKGWGRLRDYIKRQLLKTEFAQNDEVTDKILDNVLLRDRVQRHQGNDNVNFEAMAFFAMRDVLKIERKVRENTPYQISDELEDRNPHIQRMNDKISVLEVNIKHECLADCLKKLPEETQEILREYYYDEIRTPKERVASRRRLAEKLGVKREDPSGQDTQLPGHESDSDSDSDSEETKKWIRNLRKRVCGRKKLLEQCIKHCTEEKMAKHSDLQYYIELKK